MVTGCPLFTFTTPTGSVTGPIVAAGTAGTKWAPTASSSATVNVIRICKRFIRISSPFTYQFGLNAHGEQLQNCDTAVLALTPFSLIRGATPVDPHTHRHSNLPGRDKRFAAPPPTPPQHWSPRSTRSSQSTQSTQSTQSNA